MSDEAIEAYPWFLNKPLDVTVNDLVVTTRITVREWTDHLRPLLAHIHQLVRQQPGRLMIAIGGPPGTGKSVLAEQISWLAEKGFIKGSRCMALAMDGFHYPNEYLAKHTHKMPDGQIVPMSQLKGSPGTFDITGLRERLKQLRDCAEEVFWPGYSRIGHDVQPNRYRIHKSCNIVIVEGNYMLLDRGPFAGLPGIFDFRMYVELPGPGIIANLVQRHIGGGKTMEVAKEWVRRIDLPNARLAESTRANADVIIERNTVDDIIGLHWRADGFPPIEGGTASNASHSPVAASPASASPAAPADAPKPS